MKAKKQRCPTCEWWDYDGGGWGFCRNYMNGQDVQHWHCENELTFKNFGCVYHKVFKEKKKKSKEVEG